MSRDWEEKLDKWEVWMEKAIACLIGFVIGYFSAGVIHFWVMG